MSYPMQISLLTPDGPLKEEIRFQLFDWKIVFRHFHIQYESHPLSMAESACVISNNFDETRMCMDFLSVTVRQ